MSKDSTTTTNKLEWAVNQAYVFHDTYPSTRRHGACEYCQMDLNIIMSGQTNQSTTSNRNSNDRRHHRSYGDSVDSSDTLYQGRLASMGIIPSKLEPFKTTDISNGIYADESDPLGRTWYHIPNLGAKFCDAVRKYSIIANYREAHVIARKKSKDSECMWIGIVGDPATYTTGSKRHLIDMMLRNPGQSFDGGSRRHHAKIRTNRTTTAGKRRKRRRRRYPFLSDSRNESESSNSISAPRRGPDGRSRSRRSTPALEEDQAMDEVTNAEPDDSGELSSTPVSSTPSVLSMDHQVSNPFDFHIRETVSSPPTRGPGLSRQHMNPRLAKFNLPEPTNTLNINTDQVPAPERDWGFVSVYRDPVQYALREPPLPSPDAGKVFSFNRMESRPTPSISKLNQPTYPVHPRSPTVNTMGHSGIRKYSVSDLNDLLVSADGLGGLM